MVTARTLRRDATRPSWPALRRPDGARGRGRPWLDTPSWKGIAPGQVALRRGSRPGCTGSGRPPVHSPDCESHRRAPRGQQGQGHRRGRRGGVRAGGRCRVPEDRPRGPHPRVPARQGAPPAARGPLRPRGRPRAGAARRAARVLRRGRARARGRRHRPARDRHHRGRGGRARSRSTPSSRSGPVVAARRLRRPARRDPRAAAADEEVDAQIDWLRSQFAELERRRRPAADGDYVTIDIAGSQDGEAVDGPHRRATTSTRSAPAPSSPSSTSSCAAPRRRRCSSSTPTHPSAPSETPEEPLHFERLVKEVKRRCSPSSTTSGSPRRPSSRPSTSCATTSPPASPWCSRPRPRWPCARRSARSSPSWSTTRCPRPLVAPEMQSRLQDLAMRLQAQGINLEQWLPDHRHRAPSSSSPSCARPPSGPQVDLALRAVAVAEAIEAPTTSSRPSSPRSPSGSNEDADTVREELTEAGQIRRYAPTSRSARRSSGSSRPSTSSTRTATPSASPSSPSSRSTRTTTRPTPTATEHRHRRGRRGLDPSDERSPSESARGPAGLKSATTSRSPSSSRPTAGERITVDLYSRLLKEHIIFLGTPIDDTVANLIWPSCCTSSRRTPTRTSTSTSIARRRHHRAVRHLRHDAVHQARHHDDLHRPGRLGRRGAARRRHPGQALRPARTPAS